MKLKKCEKNWNFHEKRKKTHLFRNDVEFFMEREHSHAFRPILKPFSDDCAFSRIFHAASKRKTHFFQKIRFCQLKKKRRFQYSPFEG
jgi:hypothetical protein